MTIHSMYSDPKKPDDRPATAAALGEIFCGCADFETRAVWPGGRKISGVSVCWIDGLVDGGSISELVLRPLTDSFRLAAVRNAADCALLLERGAVFSFSVKRRESAAEVSRDLLHGSCAVVLDELGCALTFEAKSAAGRSISEPTVEKSVKGAKDSFVETLRTNTALVRKKLRASELKLWQTVVGRRSGTDVAVLWLDGVANRDTLRELRRRLAAIDVDGLTSAGGLEQYITDRPRSPLPQLLHTERPDKFAAELLAGRIGILVDGLPIGFLLPATMAKFMQVAEDRGQHFVTASALRLLRWLSVGISALFPAFFVAVSMYHQEMIPEKLLLSMVAAKQEVPFSVAFEVIAMLIAFELLMEAGLRLPDPVGDAVSLIGALIVGQSAVEARIVSPIAVIVVATAAICGFTQPSRDLAAALRALRLLMMLLSLALGMFGLAAGSALTVWYLCTIESFGVAYTAPMSEGGARNAARAILQQPLPDVKFRERELGTEDKRCQK